MSGFLFGLFIGAVVGVNIGLIILAVNMSNQRVRDKLIKQREEKITPVPSQKMDPYDVTTVHYCLECNHKWREYALLYPAPCYCPNCGRKLDDVERGIENDDSETAGTGIGRNDSDAIA